MIAFEVHLNGEKLCLASVGDYGVLSQHLSWVESKAKAQSVPAEKRPKASLRVGGLVDGQHVNWIQQQAVDVGDEITLKIVEVAKADEVIRREAAETDAELAAKVEAGFKAVEAELPSSPVEAGFLTSLAGYRELRALNESEMAVKVLANLGDANNCPPDFWAELQAVAQDLQMYRQLDGYRKKAGLDDEADEK